MVRPGGQGAGFALARPWIPGTTPRRRLPPRRIESGWGERHADCSCQ